MPTLPREFLLRRKILFRLAFCPVLEQSKIIWTSIWPGTSLERIIRAHGKAGDDSCLVFANTRVAKHPPLLPPPQKQKFR